MTLCNLAIMRSALHSDANTILLPIILRQATISKMVMSIAIILISVASNSKVDAQGMPGGGPQDAAPAFNDPRFRDRVWEAGGPRMSEMDGRIVTGVNIIGNQSVSESFILSKMQTRQDRVFDAKQLEADIRELYRTELFQIPIKPYINESPEGVVVTLELRELPTILSVDYHGNMAIEDGKLEKHAGLKKGDPINPSSVESARRRLLDLYIDNAFNHVDIRIASGNRPGDRNVIFDISEGHLERIWAINFEGNTIASNALLKTKITSRDAAGGIKSHMFNRAVLSKIESDQITLEAYYRSLGFFQARVGRRLEYSDNGKWINLTFVIAEGPQYYVQNVSVIGNRYHSSEELMAALELKNGMAFNLAKMNVDVRSLKDIYGAQGFVFVDIQAEPRYLDEPGKMDLVYKIEEGDRYRASEIRVHIEGDSSHTKHNVVLNYVGVRPMDIIDMREIEASERRLRFSQIFESNPTIGEPPRIVVRPPDEAEEFTFRKFPIP